MLIIFEYVTYISQLLFKLRAVENGYFGSIDTAENNLITDKGK